MSSFRGETMYNVRIIEYPTGYQVRVYDGLMGVDEEEGYRSREEKEKRVRAALQCDEWYATDLDFEEIDEVVSERISESLRISMSRTKKMIYYLARSNVWEWFVTLTLAPDKVDRYDYRELVKKVRKWFDNLRQRRAPEMYYLIVPEQHKDGAWHFHGLLGGCRGLTFTDSGKRDASGHVIYHMDNWKYGFSTATEVSDTERVSSYICKYITKEMCASVSGRQRYWVSHNVNRAKMYEAVVPWYQMEQFRAGLYETMTYKTKAFTEFFDVEYFEVTKDWAGVEFVEK